MNITQMRWLFLVHQIYTPNSKERVKVWRAIKKTGAVLHRNSVYVLPYGRERLEDFQWVCQQILESKGEASVFVSDAHDVKEDRVLQSLFQKAREEDYAQLLAALEKLKTRVSIAKRGKQLTERLQNNFEKEAEQLREVFDDIRKVDFFSNSPPRRVTRTFGELSAELASTLRQAKVPPVKGYSSRDFQKKVWATREGIHIDRLGSAWLIRRFIDPAARFVFAAENHLPEYAIPFDTLGAEFSHHGDDCTFETLMKAFQLKDTSLRQIAEIVHDLDLKDHKFGRTEAEGIDLMIRSLSDSLKDDGKLLEVGSALLDALYKFYLKKSTKRK